MAKQFLEIEIDVPEGYQAVGYRNVKFRELFLNGKGTAEVWRAVQPSTFLHVILKEVKPLSDEEATERTRDILEAMHANDPAPVQVYNVGPDAMDDYMGVGKKYVWVVADYTIGDYCGDGDAISWDGSVLRRHNLSHCSCYGPEDGMEGGDVLNADDLFGDAVKPGWEFSEKLLAKVRELLGK